MESKATMITIVREAVSAQLMYQHNCKGLDHNNDAGDYDDDNANDDDDTADYDPD